VAELLVALRGKLTSVTLVPVDGGRFEVSVDGKRVFSKLELKRFPEEGEVVKLVARKSA